MSARKTCLIAVCAVAATMACYRAKGPATQPTPQEALRSAFGGWIMVSLRNENPQTVVAGELIAVDADTLHLLSASGFMSIPRQSIKSLALERYRVSLSQSILASVAGTLSTVGNGYILILTAPAWIIAGSVSTAMYSRAPLTRSTSAAELQPFARFPQGIPASVDRSRLVLRGAALPGKF